MNKVWHIIKNTERYGDDPHSPNNVTCEGTKEQAIWLAHRLTDYFPGQSYYFYVKEVDDLVEEEKENGMD